MAVHQAPLSLGFSRQEHWSGLPFPSPVHESEKQKWSRSVVLDCQRPHGPQPSRLLRPWDFPGKSTGVGFHYLLRSMSRGYEVCVPSYLYLSTLNFSLKLSPPKAQMPGNLSFHFFSIHHLSPFTSVPLRLKTTAPSQHFPHAHTVSTYACSVV